MVSKEKFKEIINYLKEKEETLSQIDGLIRNSRAFVDGMVPIDNGDSYLIELLEMSFGLPADDTYGTTLSWWTYDLNFGENFKVGDIEIPNDSSCPFGKTPDIGSIDALYDFLVWEGASSTEHSDSQAKFFDQ